MRSLVYIFCLAILLGACETNVEPFLDRIQPPLHIVDGFLDGETALQQIRVQKVRRTTVPLPVTRDEFTVTSTDDFSSDVTTWRDSLITLSDGSTGHLFTADLQPRPGATYRLRVRDADGESLYLTTVPGQPSVALRPIFLEPTVTQTVSFVTRRSAPPELAVSYLVTEPESATRHEFSFSYAANGRFQNGSWDVDVFLRADRNRIGGILGRPREDTLLVLNSVTVTFELLSPEWSALNSSTRAAGFFGSIGSYGIDIPIDQDTRDFLDVQ